MREITYANAINEALQEEMERDETVFWMGENVSSGGGLLIGMGLFEKFGSQRVRDTTISEDAIVGACIGAAIAGYRPIGELMFADFFAVAGDEILNQAAKWRFVNGGKIAVPMVIETSIGGYGRNGPGHSQCAEALLMHNLGLKIAIPSTPGDAKGLMKTAIRDNNPVVFLYHKMLLGTAGAVPEKEYTIPFGVADIKRPGKDVTVVATAYMVKLALDAAEQLEKKGISVEVVDPRTLEPLDIGTIVASVKKTRRAVVVDEDTLRCGVGAEIGMQIMENAYDYLDAPVKRIGAANLPIAGGFMEQYILPQTKNIIAGIEEVMRAR